MTKNSNQPSSQNQAPTNGDDTSNPLDQLEELIKKAQSSSGASTSDLSSAETLQTPGENESQTPEQAELDAQQQMREISKLKEQKAEEEKLLIAQQQELMRQTVVNSSQTQKRNEAAAQEAKERQSPTDGFEIKQLTHTKIKKPIDN